MTEVERVIFDEHVRKEELFRLNYELMGQLLKKDVVADILKKRGWKSCYIYGGAYLGIQAFYAFSSFIPIAGFIDRAQSLYIPIKEVEVLSLEEFYKQEDNYPVIITPLEYAKEIKEELLTHISEERIVFLNELF